MSISFNSSENNFSIANFQSELFHGLILGFLLFDGYLDFVIYWESKLE